MIWYDMIWYDMIWYDYICTQNQSHMVSNINRFKDRVMGPLLVLVWSCFRKHVVVSYKSVSFLCSLYGFVLKNVIDFLFGHQIFEMEIIKNKESYFDLLFTLLVPRERHKNSFSTFLICVHTRILLTLLTFFLLHQCCKNVEFIMYGLSLARLLVLFLIRAILEQSRNHKMVSKM